MQTQRNLIQFYMDPTNENIFWKLSWLLQPSVGENLHLAVGERILLFEMDVLAGGLWHRRQRQEDGKCKTSLGYTERSCLKRLRLGPGDDQWVKYLLCMRVWAGFSASTSPGLRGWRQVDPGSSLSNQSSQTSELWVQWETWLQKVTQRSWRHG